MATIFEDIFDNQDEIKLDELVEGNNSNEWDTELDQGKQPNTWNTGKQAKDVNDIWSVG